MGSAGILGRGGGGGGGDDGDGGADAAAPAAAAPPAARAPSPTPSKPEAPAQFAFVPARGGKALELEAFLPGCITLLISSRSIGMTETTSIASVPSAYLLAMSRWLRTGLPFASITGMKKLIPMSTMNVRLTSWLSTNQKSTCDW